MLFLRPAKVAMCMYEQAFWKLYPCFSQKQPQKGSSFGLLRLKTNNNNNNNGSHLCCLSRGYVYHVKSSSYQQ